MSKKRIKVCVLGATGLIGSNLVREGLARGYYVKGVARNIDNTTQLDNLRKLPNAENGLELHKADMSMVDSLVRPLNSVDCVFIACLTPTFYGSSGKPAKEMNDEQGYREIISPTVDGCLNVLKTAVSKNIKNVVICSSTSSTNPNPSVSIKNENHWSDEKFQCDSKKYTSAAKTVMEKKAINFAKENDLKLSIIMPTGLYGPVIFPSHLKGNPHVWLRRLIDGEHGRHQKIPNDSTSLIHLYDLAKMFYEVYEQKDKAGRFFGVYDSWHWEDIYKEIRKNLPDMMMPESYEGEKVEATKFDFTRRDSLGIKFRDIPTCISETIDWLKIQNKI